MSKKGFSLVEIAIAMAVTAILASSVIPLAIKGAQIKAAEKTSLEILMIQEASRNYFIDHQAWPLDMTVLQEQGYLNPQWIIRNPWQHAYQISSTAQGLTVSSQVPDEWTKLVASRLSGAVINNEIVSSTIASLASAGISSGVIVAWSGTIASIPKGWALCDGNNGTPDLRDRFIIGARKDSNGSANTEVLGSPLQTGGSVTHNHSGLTGSHVLTVAEIPSFQVNLPTFSPNQGGNGASVQRGQNPADGALQLTTNGGGQGHTHTISSDYHLPPFYALAFIMKL